MHYVTYGDRLGLITANATTPYTLNFFDLNETGPLVIELPPGPTAGGVSDFWQREIGVLGEMGPDQGRGGKHIDRPARHGRSRTRDECTSLRFDRHERDVRLPDARSRPRARQALVDAVRIYSYAARGPPADPRDLPGRASLAGDQPRGLAYWERLHEIYQPEVVDERDRFYMAMLRQLGIEQGKPFAARRAPARDPGGKRRGRRADGPGQHLRQALRRLALLA